MEMKTVKTYTEQLRDPRWQKRRLQILLRDNFQCRKCGSHDKTLSVHHGEYNGAPWETPADKLVTLCDECHPEGAVSIQVVLQDLMGKILPTYHECNHCGFPVDVVDFVCEDIGCPHGPFSKSVPEVKNEG